MQAVLDWMATRVERTPGRVLLALGAVTVVMAGLGTRFETTTDIADYAGNGVAAELFERVEEDFGARGASVVVLVDAGPGGDVLTPQGLAMARSLEERIAATPEVAGRLAEPTPLAPPISSYADPVVRLADDLGVSPDGLVPGELDELVRQAFFLPRAEQAATLLSGGFVPGDTRAGAGLVIVALAQGIDDEPRAEAALAIDGLVRDTEGGDFRLLAFSVDVLQDELDTLLLQELPLLSGISMLLIAVILFVTFRRVSDVLLSLAGLVVTLVWMAGMVVLLGPEVLGVTGYFSQIAIAVPVLLIGLGVDYSIHLTLRYREERAAGRAPAVSAGNAVRNVGRALVLVTVTTMVGFLANLISPVPPIRDFAVFTAVGVFGAMTAVGLLVPSARVLLDRRAGAKGPPSTPDGSPGALTSAMCHVASLAARFPVRSLAVAGVVTVAGFTAASALGTEFSQDDFIPDDSRAGIAIETLEDRFDGDVTEQTFVVVDGPVTEPVVANAMLDASDRLAGVEDVQTIAGRADVQSPPGLAREIVELAAEGARVDPAITAAAEELIGFGFDGSRFAPDADVAAAYDVVTSVLPSQMEGLLSDARRSALMIVGTRAGEERAQALEERFDEALAPINDTAATARMTSQPLLISLTLDELIAGQAQKIVFTMLVAVVLLTLYFGIRQRSPVMGLITLVPTVVALALVLGSMWLLGLPFNAVTATITSIAIGFGVDYGIHVSNRFAEDREKADDAAGAIAQTVTHTGVALVASAVTTSGAFAILMLSGFLPLRQFGGLTALTMVFALLATLVAESGALVLWDRRRGRPVAT